MFRRKIPCYVIVYDQTEIVCKTLDALASDARRLDIVVIENPSKNTPVIKKYIDKLGQQKKIKRYYLFKENVSGNALLSVLEKEAEIIKNSAHIIITDGDLVPDSGWLCEEKRVLRKYKDVLTCGVTLNKSNLPLEAFPNASEWIPDDIAERKYCFEAITGGHLLLFRGKEFAEYLSWRRENNLPHLDGTMHRYCSDVKKMHWARTKQAKAYHLTWDLYSDRSHPYTKMKLSKTFEETWHKQENGTYHATVY